MNLYGRGDNFACYPIERRINEHVPEGSKEGADRDGRRFRLSAVLVWSYCVPASGVSTRKTKLRASP